MYNVIVLKKKNNSMFNKLFINYLLYYLHLNYLKKYMYHFILDLFQHK